jgi:hypothetical protein
VQSHGLTFENTTEKFRPSAAGCTQRGTGRENNEDSIHITPNVELLIATDGGGDQENSPARPQSKKSLLSQTTGRSVVRTICSSSSSPKHYTVPVK